MGARSTRTHLPEDSYLTAVGQLAYMVTSLEGLLIWDVPGFAAYLPAGLTPASLANKTTGQIGRTLQDAVSQITDDDVAAYYREGAEVLIAAASARNDVLHARPATDSEGRTRLNRWSQGGAVAFWITDEWIAEQLDALSAASVRLNELRPLNKCAQSSPQPGAKPVGGNS